MGVSRYRSTTSTGRITPLYLGKWKALSLFKHAPDPPLGLRSVAGRRLTVRLIDLLLPLLLPSRPSPSPPLPSAILGWFHLQCDDRVNPEIEYGSLAGVRLASLPRRQSPEPSIAVARVVRQQNFDIGKTRTWLRSDHDRLAFCLSVPHSFTLRCSSSGLGRQFSRGVFVLSSSARRHICSPNQLSRKLNSSSLSLATFVTSERTPVKNRLLAPFFQQNGFPRKRNSLASALTHRSRRT